MKNHASRQAQSKAVTTRQFGCNIPSTGHRAEDALKVLEVRSGERTVYIGAVSDGCTGNRRVDRTDFGAKWIVETFCSKAKAALNKGLRGIELMRESVLSCVRDMSNYQPGFAGSSFEECHGKEFCKELCATLFAYISTNEETVLFLTGNGYIFCNDRVYEIEQKSGDMYLPYLYRFPETQWEQRFDQVFTTAVVPTEKLRTLIIASDGVDECKHLYDYLRTKGNDPEKAKAAINAYHKAHPELLRQGFYSDSWDHDPELGITPDPQYHYCSYSIDDISFVSLIRSVSGPVPKLDLSQAAAKASAINRDKLGSAGRTKTKKVVAKTSKRRLLALGQTGILFDMDWFVRGTQPHGYLGRTETDFSFRLPKVENGNVAKCMYGSVGSGLDSQQTAAQAMERTRELMTSKLWPELRAGTVPEVYAVVDSENRQTLALAFAETSGCTSLDRFADYDWCRRNGFGLKHMCRILSQINEKLKTLHSLGIRLGNLRLQDVLVKVVHKGRHEVDVRFINPEVWAINRPDLKITRDYFELDPEFIHPVLLPALESQVGDDGARKYQDHFAMANLMANLLYKMDPFMVGMVKDEPDVDRIYRMQHKLSYWKRSKLDPGPRPWEFYARALKRIELSVHDCILAIIGCTQLDCAIPASLSTMADEMIRCKGKRTRTDGTQFACNFQVHKSISRCPVCSTPLDPSKVFSRHLPAAPGSETLSE